ncbi:MAG: M56 family metallopeptidase [Planctomycetales bacterium]|nr:M56 family metallopeptidase [Planctomycetales bacterium]
MSSTIDWLPLNPVHCWLIVLSILHATWQCGLLWLVYNALSQVLVRSSIHFQFRLAMGTLLMMGVIPLANAFLISTRAARPDAILCASESYVETGRIPLVAISKIYAERELRQSVTYRHELSGADSDGAPPQADDQTRQLSALGSKDSLQSDTAISGASGAINPTALSAEIQWEVVLSVCVACAYLVGLAFMLCRILSALASHWRLVSTVQRPEHQNHFPESIRKIARRAASQFGRSLNLRLGAYQGKGVAIVIGVLRPTVLLNTTVLTGLTPVQIEQVLIHELAHIHRWDPLTQLLQRLVESLLFFHPSVWSLSREVSGLRERCCDEAVVQSHSRIEYAKTLLSVLEARPTSSPFALGFTGSFASGFQARVSALLLEKPSVSSTDRVLPVLGTSTGLVLAGLLSVLFFANPNDAPTPQAGNQAPVFQVVDSDAATWIQVDPKKVDPFGVMVGGRVLELQQRKPEDLTLSAGLPTDEARFTQWQFGDFESTSVALMLVGTDESHRIYLDRNRDRILDSKELLAKPVLGKAWVTELDVEVRDIENRTYRAKRQIAITPMSAGSRLRINTLGFFQGQVDVSGRAVAFRRYDKDGNGIPTDSSDQISVDLDGNDDFDELSERFSVRPVLELSGQSYSMFSDRLGHELKLQLVKDFGEIDFQFALADAQAGLRSLQGSLRDESGHLIAIRAEDLLVRVPAGRYAIEHLVLVAHDEDGTEWRMTLASSSDQSWFQVQANARLEVPLLTSLHFRVDSNNPPSSDGSRSIQPSLVSHNGLMVTELKCEDAAKSNGWDQGVAARFELVSSESSSKLPVWPHATCSSGFG